VTDPRAISTSKARVWLDQDDILHYARLPGNKASTTKEDAEELMACTWELAGHRRLPLLVDVRTVKAIDRDARAHLAGPAGARLNSAVALLVGSPLSRAIGNFFIGLNKPLIPCRMFSLEAEALAWLRGFLE
jgi:hypothetical protein